MPIEEIIQQKAALRRGALERRKGFDQAWRAAASAAIARRLLERPEMVAARTVALFSSFGGEVETRPLIEEVIRLKAVVALPRVVRGEKRLEFHRVSDTAKGFVNGCFGIREPDPRIHQEVVGAAGMDLIIVPGLLFDRRGYRIGYGGGYYDQLLAQPRQARAIGIVFSCFLTDTLPTAPWDQPVDAVCTEEEIIEVKR